MVEPNPAGDQRILAQVLDSIADPIVAFDKDWRYIFVSRRAADAFGKRPEEMLGKSMWALFPDDADTGFQEACQRAWRDARPVTVERFSKVLNQWVQNDIYPFENGASTQWRDITDRKKAEKAVRESEAVLRGFFDSPGVMHGIVSLEDGEIIHVSCNDAAADMYGIARDAIPGKSATECGAPEPVVRVWVKLYEESRLTGKPVSMEYSRRDADGVEHWMLTAATCIGTGPSGHPRFAYSILDLTEHKRAEEAMRENEGRLRTLGDNLPEAALYQYRLDAAGQAHIDFVSAGIERLTGVAAAEYMTDSSKVERLIFPEDRARLHVAIEYSREHLTRFELEVRSKHAETGETRWSLLRSTPVRNADGSTTWTGIHLDITRRKKAEEALCGVQERLRRRIEELETIMNVAPVAIWVAHDPECLDITGNPMANTFYEAGAGENVSATTVDFRRFFLNGVELSAEELPMQQAAAGNRDVRDAQLDVLLPSGREMSMFGHASPLLDESGRVRGAVGAFLDITERKRAEVELKRVSEIIKLAHKAANAGTWRLDLQTNELFWADECFNLFGVDPATRPTPELHLSLVHPEDRARINSSFERALNAPNREIRDDYRIIKPDGYHWLERRAMVVSDRDGRPVQFVGISSDVTERKRLEMALRRSNEDLQRIAYVASHDLQEPLRNIGVMTSLLLRENEGRLTPQSKEFAGLIARGVRTMNGLVESLVEFYQVTNDQSPHRKVKLGDVVSKALENLSAPIRASGAHIDLSPLPEVAGNPELLVYVFQNLLSNSIKFCREGVQPVISISAEDAGDEWRLAVRDNGIGFDMKYANQIFMAFKRLHANSSGYPGAGIGLAIVKRIVDQHGGKVYVESKPGCGSTFHFTLPKNR